MKTFKRYVSIFLEIILIYIFCSYVWISLEFIIYQETMPRVVDDIVAIIFAITVRLLMLYYRKKITLHEGDPFLETSKMITVSSFHLSGNSIQILDNPEEYGIISYRKESYGWFVYVDIYDFNENNAKLPDDLASVIKFAKKRNYSILCIDHDGPIVDALDLHLRLLTH